MKINITSKKGIVLLTLFAMMSCGGGLKVQIMG